MMAITENQTNDFERPVADNMANYFVVFPWNKIFETGISLIDQQHRKLVGLLNQLAAHLVRNEPVELRRVFEELVAYADYHFKTEDSIWEPYFKDDQWLKSHQETHASFLPKVLELMDEEKSKPLNTVIEDVIKFLIHWFTDHTLDYDKRMAIVLRCVDSGQSLDQAKLTAKAEIRAEANTMIASVLTDSLSSRTLELMKEREDRRRVEEELCKRTKELELANQIAENEIKAKALFLASMSHEIRTPMNGVVGMVDILTQMDMPPEQKRMIQTIHNSSFSLLRIIDDILDTSKIEAGKLELENIPVQLHQTIEGIVETIIPTADAGNVRLSLYIDRMIPKWIYSDAVRLRQIMLNLFSNAVKFSRRKKGEAPGRVRCRVELLSTNTLQFKVIDDGVGMSEEVRSRLFKPFAQGEESTTRKFGGTGLGLVISLNLSEMMGGTITVESTPGVGSTFTVTLPFIEAEGVASDPDISGLKLLALVDDLMSRETISRYVEHYGSTIRYADTEAELAAWLVAEAGVTIILLAQQTMAENDRIRETLSGQAEQYRFICFTADRSDKVGLVQPECYVIQRFPVRPSDLFLGLATLSGRQKSRVDGAADKLETFSSAPSIEEAEARNQLVLLVEDNQTNQEVIKYQLDMLGYAVEAADDGQQGLQLWKTGRFGLVLSDCHMPVMDGFEMTDAIRKTEKEKGLPRVPIVAITANALHGDDDSCLAAGMDDYLSKPIELKHLEQTLRRWLPKQSEQGSLLASEDRN